MLILIFTEKRSFRLTVDEALSRLQKSAFRAKFHLSDEDINYIDKKGLDTVKSHAEDFIKKRLAPAVIPNDGKQTPYKGHPIFTAQHATGCCCRGCLYKWHGIDKGRELTEEELNNLGDVILEWIHRDLQKPAPRKRVRKGETLDLFDQN